MSQLGLVEPLAVPTGTKEPMRPTIATSSTRSTSTRGDPGALWKSKMQTPRGSANGRPRDRMSYAASIVDTLPDPTLVLDGDLRIKAANRAFYEYFMTVQSDIAGKIVFDLPCFEWDGPNGRNVSGWLLRREYSLRDIELVQDIPLFGERVMILSAQNLPSEGPDPELTTLVIQDTTEPRRAYEGLQSVCDKFEHEAKELRRSNENLQRFTQIASHDLRAPLLAVLQCIQILEDRCKNKFDEEDFSDFEYITRTMCAMTVFISDLLYYSQVYSGSPEIAPVTNTHAVLQTALANLRVSIIETEATVTHESLPGVHVHPTELLELFQNLIGNAIQYRKTLRPQIHISATRRDDCWVFAVRDNGIGIRPQYCDCIFEPFRRLHGKERPGSGLGLSICKEIVERHGGRIWVESEIHKGSTFYLAFVG